ncbi:MAG: DUF3822 family protein [Capnocytophaga sp.]|nr:DUF3822 family protein [Capnocytophaga sp.]
MEIGLPYTMQELPENSILQTYFKALSIQVNLSGLSFCVFNPALEKVETIYQFAVDFKYPNRAAIEKQLQSIFSTEGDLRQEFDTIKVLHNTEHFAFVPRALYTENTNAHHYLKYSVRIDNQDYVATDPLDVIDVVNVYSPNVLVNNVLLDYYGPFDYQHTATALLRMFLTHYATQPYDVMYVYIEKTTFYIAYFHQKNLHYFNRFEYETKDDFLYFLLYSAEQLGIDMEQIPLYINGAITAQSPLFHQLKIYIRKVRIMEYKGRTKPADMDTELFQQNFILTQMF